MDVATTHPPLEPLEGARPHGRLDLGFWHQEDKAAVSALSVVLWCSSRRTHLQQDSGQGPGRSSEHIRRGNERVFGERAPEDVVGRVRRNPQGRCYLPGLRGLGEQVVDPGLQV